MKNSLALIAVFTLLFVTACQTDDLSSKKKELDEKKKQLTGLQQEITELQKAIAVLDTTARPDNSVLVSSKKITKEQFNHSVSFRGSVASKRSVNLSAETMGRIISINATAGQKVSAGQAIVTLDSDIIRNNINELKTSRDLAKTVYEKQKRLWEQNIGSELQYLEAKNNYESLENKLATANSQLSKTIVKAPFAGVIDDLPAKLGEMAQPGMPLVRIVGSSDMYVEADVSERFLGRFDYGDSLSLFFPFQDKTYKSKINVVGSVINPENRTFTIEASLKDISFEVKPNQVVVMDIVDYSVPDAILVPSVLVQADFNSKFIYVLEKQEDKLIARKREVKVGKTFEGETEILSGLSVGEEIVLDGFRDITDGAAVRISDRDHQTANL